MNSREAMRRIDALLSHVWLVRTFLKHSEEAEEDDELLEIVRDLYDSCLAVGPAWSADQPDEYLKIAGKKWTKLDQAARRFRELQPEVSAHTNFKMAVQSVETAVADIGQILRSVSPGA